jgi:hypothetical protein
MGKVGKGRENAENAENVLVRGKLEHTFHIARPPLGLARALHLIQLR